MEDDFEEDAEVEDDGDPDDDYEDEIYTIGDTLDVARDIYCTTCGSFLPLHRNLIALYYQPACISHDLDSPLSDYEARICVSSPSFNGLKLVACTNCFRVSVASHVTAFPLEDMTLDDALAGQYRMLLTHGYC